MGGCWERTSRRGRFVSWCLLALLMISPVLSQAVEGDDSSPRFTIERYEVEGNTLLDGDELADLFAPFTGAGRQVSDIESARQALLLAYAEAGYGTVRVSLPEQELHNGVVLLRVTEIRIGQVVVEGNQRLDETNVRASLPGLSEGATPNTRRLAESLRIANENPGKQTHLFLRNGTQPRELDAVIRVVEQDPWRSFVTLDNTGNEETGNNRLGVGFQHTNVANHDQVLTLQYVTSPDKTQDVQIYGLGYRIPLYGAADSIDLFGGYSSVDSGTVADVFNVSGKGTLFGARYNHNLGKHAQFQHQLIYGLDYREFENDVDFMGVPIGTKLTVSPVTLSYVGRWQVEGFESGFHLAGTRNVPDGGDENFTAMRSGARADYSAVRVRGDVVKNITGEWSARVVWEGQYTEEPLVPSEQFGLGGAASVRGFGEREIADDRGYRASFELHTPEFANRWGWSDARAKALIFHDLGRVTRVDALPGEVSETDVGSAGVGFRVGVGRYLSLTLDYARVVDGSAQRAAGEELVHGSLGAVF